VREAQRDAVDRAMPEEASLLRKADGTVLVYEEQDEKRRPVELRAVVLPDGETLEVEHNRFSR
jgi:hypothetical protein